MPNPTMRRDFHSKIKSWVQIVLAILASVTLILSRMTPNAFGDSLNFSNLPRPFVTQDNLMNCTSVVASSVGHGPCGGCHTMDVMGAIMVGGQFGLKTDSGTMEATMDDYISSYNFTTGTVELRDHVSNLVVVGGPGVNQVTWHYNSLKYLNGSRMLPAYFNKFINGTDYIYVGPSSHRYVIEYDGLGRVSADYGLIEVFDDNGRHVLILAGLGGSGTWASCKVISSYESWGLNGCAAIVRYRDTNGDGFLDTLSIAEQVSGTINLYSAITPLPFGLLAVTILPKLKVLVQKIRKKRFLAAICLFLFLAAASQITLTVFSDDLDYGPYTFRDFTHPFVSAGGLLNSTAVVASSVGHGPCGGCHTMDVMGGIMVGAQMGIDADGGSLDSTLDDYISYYDIGTGHMTFSPLSNNLLVVGGPGVNQITWYYNNLRNGSGARVLPIYFDKFPNGTDYIYVASTDHYYVIERDGLGRVSADYGALILYHDIDNGWWVVIAAGLGGSGTNAASRLLANYKAWSLFGQDVIVKYADTDSDGFLDTISVPEVVGIGQSIDVFWDAVCLNPVGAIDWGTLVPGDMKNITVYVRNEGESGTVLALNVSDWNPLQASNYLDIEWNYSGSLVQPGQVLPLVLSLAVDQNIYGVTDFGVNVTVSSG